MFGKSNFKKKMAIYSQCPSATSLGLDARFRIAKGKEFGCVADEVLVLHKFFDFPVTLGAKNPYNRTILNFYKGPEHGEYLLVFEK